MYGKEDFTAQARGAKMRGDFMKAAMQCGHIARLVDGDIPAREIDEMCRMASDLQAELTAMRARAGRLSR
jgi:hypothetical protein